MSETKTCRKPRAVAAEYAGERGGAHVVVIRYDNGRSGELLIPKDKALRNSAAQKEYERQMVFGRHHWDRKSQEEYARLEVMIDGALGDRTPVAS